MQENDRARFGEILVGVMHYYRQQAPSVLMMEIWWNGVQDFTISEFESAMAAHISCPSKGQWVPTIAHLVEWRDGNSANEAAVAWGVLIDAVSSIGHMNHVLFEDVKISHTVRELGGWQYLCGLSHEKTSKYRVDFDKMYRSKCSDRRKLEPLVLQGSCSADSVYEKRGLPPPEVKIVKSPKHSNVVYLNNGMHLSTSEA